MSADMSYTFLGGSNVLLLKVVLAALLQLSSFPNRAVSFGRTGRWPEGEARMVSAGATSAEVLAPNEVQRAEQMLALGGVES